MSEKFAVSPSFPFWITIVESVVWYVTYSSNRDWTNDLLQPFQLLAVQSRTSSRSNRDKKERKRESTVFLYRLDSGWPAPPLHHIGTQCRKEFWWLCSLTLCMSPYRSICNALFHLFVMISWVKRSWPEVANKPDRLEYALTELFSNNILPSFYRNLFINDRCMYSSSFPVFMQRRK